MGKPTDKNKPTKNLDELLEHLHRGGDDLDAFEQEALEGFASLESKQEALDLKQRLDERMEEKLSKKRKPLFIYWSAAAGIALILGLIFITRTNQDLKSESGLADNTVLSEKKLENTEINPVAPPAELKQEATKTGAMGGKDNSQSSSNEQQAYKKGPSREEQTTTKPDESPLALAKDASNEPAKEAENDAQDSKRSDNSKSLDDLAANNKNQNTVPASAAAGSGGDANAEKGKAKADKDEEDKSETKATEYFSRKAKKEKSVSQPSANNDQKPKTEIEGSFEKSNIKIATLTIKENELMEKLNKFFSDKDYKRSFICTLTINADNKVESVVFQNPELFRKSEQKEIRDFFQKLKCFKNNEYAVYSTYTLNYKAQ